MITIKNLDFSYGKTPIYKGFNLHIPEGQSCLITGINGVGKSTLLRLMAGVLKPDDGRIMYNAKLGDTPKRKIGFISDKLSIYESMTVEESIRLHKSVYDIATFDDSMMKHTKIRPDQKIKELSIGQRTILHLSMILSAEPEILLIDEIIHSIDAYLRKFFLEQLIDLFARRKVTVVMVNVNFHDIEHMVDRVIMLKDGTIAVDETIDSLKEVVKKVTVQAPPTDVPILSHTGNDYFLYPYKEEFRAQIDGEVEDMNLTDIVAAFIGGEYV
ncbi:MAG: ABC transporter ATP-binding protein [bacterium]|nr:ABC transporter ATP-binding protein [bacterium]